MNDFPHNLMTFLITISDGGGNKETHYSELRGQEEAGQEEAGRTQRTSELLTRSTTLNLVGTVNKPP